MNNVYTYSPLDRVIWDTPSLEAIESEIERLNAKKVFIVSSSTLSKKTDEINKVIDNLFNQYKNFNKIKNERKSKKGDRLIISYKGFIDEKLFEGGSAEKETIELGNNNYFPEFDKNLIDKSRNDKIEFFMKFPKDYNREDLKDKKVKFSLTIHDILEGKKLKDEEELAAKVDMGIQESDLPDLKRTHTDEIGIIAVI